MGGRSLFSNDDGNGGGKRYKDEGGVLVCLYAMDILWMRCGGRGRDWIGVGGLSEMILRKASCRCRRRKHASAEILSNAPCLLRIEQC